MVTNGQYFLIFIRIFLSGLNTVNTPTKLRGAKIVGKVKRYWNDVKSL